MIVPKFKFKRFGNYSIPGIGSRRLFTKKADQVTPISVVCTIFAKQVKKSLRWRKGAPRRI